MRAFAFWVLERCINVRIRFIWKMYQRYNSFYMKDVSTLQFVLYERCINVRIRFIWKLIVYSLFVLDFIIFEKLSWLWKNRYRSTNFKTLQVKPPYPQNVTVMLSIPKLIWKATSFSFQQMFLKKILFYFESKRESHLSYSDH